MRGLMVSPNTHRHAWMEIPNVKRFGWLCRKYQCMACTFRPVDTPNRRAHCPLPHIPEILIKAESHNNVLLGSRHKFVGLKCLGSICQLKLVWVGFLFQPCRPSQSTSNGWLLFLAHFRGAFTQQTSSIFLGHFYDNIKN